MENTFELETELVGMYVQVEDNIFPVVSEDMGRMLVKDYLSQGIMSRLVIERAYYCKDAWAMSQDGEWLYKYTLVWRQVN